MENKIHDQTVSLIEHKTSLLKKIFTVLLVLFFVAGAIFFVLEYKNGKFSNLDSFQDYVNSYGIFGPLILTFFQCFKVVYAFIPGTLGYIVGPTLFGSVIGIICNYVGICLGSFVAFGLSRRFGSSIMRQVFSEKRYEKCMGWLKGRTKNFPVALWLALLIPISPDDFLCYFAGLTGLSFKKFVIIILTAKPWIIIVYGLIFGTVFN